MITTLAMKAELALGTIPVLADKIDNPIGDLKPNFNAFGAKGNGAMLGAIAAVWGVCLLICIGWIVIGITKYVIARRGGHVDDMGSGAATIKAAGLGFAGLTLLTVIVGAILAFTGQF